LTEENSVLKAGKGSLSYDGMFLMLHLCLSQLNSMNLSLIQSSIESYKKSLKESSELWEICKDVSDLHRAWWGSEDAVLLEYSKLYGVFITKWWPEHRNAIKRMEHYIEASDDMIRAMFDDLLSEAKDISGRVGRFIHHCDTLYKHDRRKTVHTLDHGHGDKQLIFLYLSTLLPAQYMPYDHKAMSEFLSVVGSKSALIESDTDRYVKVSRSLCKFMRKDDDLVRLVDEQVALHGSNEDAYWLMMTYGMVLQKSSS